MSPNPYESFRKPVPGIDGIEFYDLFALDSRVETLPASIRVLLESVVRNCDEFNVKKADVEACLNWGNGAGQEISYNPARVLLQDFTGVPAVVDLATMRDKTAQLGGDPQKINPQVPTDLVIDHSVVVDSAGDPKSLERNEAREFERNNERFSFLKWGSTAFDNMSVVPPGNGICHQVNLEYLARSAFIDHEKKIAYPDSVVGTDSHTTMISGLGVLGWGVGGIEAEAVMLGQPYSMALPEIVGFVLKGDLPQLCTATDLVLAITAQLRQLGVVGKIVEFIGPGAASLSVADRATIANMAPEYGATTGFFPVDSNSIDYLRNTGRSEEKVKNIKKYWEASKICCVDLKKVKYTVTVELDLSNVVPCVAGPKRPQDLIPVSKLKEAFATGLTAPVDFKSFAIAQDQVNKVSKIELKGKSYELRHGSIVIAAITSCTNTSNPSVMIGAGLLARNAVLAGLEIPAYVKTSLSPGSAVVTRYLELSKLLPHLEKLGFYQAGYGCMTCIGNSGDLVDEVVSNAISNDDLVTSAVLSGNRNFEGRVHPLTRANYLASPMLVVAYALAGNVSIDFASEPIGTTADGKPVFMSEIWPSRDEIAGEVAKCITPRMYTETYGNVPSSNKRWNDLVSNEGKLFKWTEDSTYIHLPPFFKNMSKVLDTVKPIKDAYVLGYFGDSITTDHISPAGKITKDSPAGTYLQKRGVAPHDFNSYGSRRGHDEVMIRGTFANVRLVNKLAPKVGPYTVHIPSGEVGYFYDVSQKYMCKELDTIIFAGKFYGSGSSRDWAAKGTYLQGVRAVIAESFERIHRSNLIGMGVLPLEFKKGTAETNGITGKEQWSVEVDVDSPQAKGYLISSCGQKVEVLSRIDTLTECNYYKNGGILQYMIRKLA